MNWSKYCDSKIDTGVLVLSIASGFIILIIGIYFLIIGEVSSGITIADDLGNGGGEIQTINGPGFIGIGIFILLWPLFIIINYHLKNRRKNSL